MTTNDTTTENSNPLIYTSAFRTLIVLTFRNKSLAGELCSQIFNDKGAAKAARDEMDAMTHIEVLGLYDATVKADHYFA